MGTIFEGANTVILVHLSFGLFLSPRLQLVGHFGSWVLRVGCLWIWEIIFLNLCPVSQPITENLGKVLVDHFPKFWGFIICFWWLFHVS